MKGVSSKQWELGSSGIVRGMHDSDGFGDDSWMDALLGGWVAGCCGGVFGNVGWDG
jgi:hypothetical protein